MRQRANALRIRELSCAQYMMNCFFMILSALTIYYGSFIFSSTFDFLFLTFSDATTIIDTDLRITPTDWDLPVEGIGATVLSLGSPRDELNGFQISQIGLVKGLLCLLSLIHI